MSEAEEWVQIIEGMIPAYERMGVDTRELYKVCIDTIAEAVSVSDQLKQEILAILDSRYMEMLL